MPPSFRCDLFLFNCDRSYKKITDSCLNTKFLCPNLFLFSIGIAHPPEQEVRSTGLSFSETKTLFFRTVVSSFSSKLLETKLNVAAFQSAWSSSRTLKTILEWIPEKKILQPFGMLFLHIQAYCFKAGWHDELSREPLCSTISFTCY